MPAFLSVCITYVLCVYYAQIRRNDCWAALGETKILIRKNERKCKKKPPIYGGFNGILSGLVISWRTGQKQKCTKIGENHGNFG